MSDENTPEGKRRIEQDTQGQKGYRLKNSKGIEVGIVVAPFREGFCVWGIDLGIGAAPHANMFICLCSKKYKNISEQMKRKKARNKRELKV